MTMRLDPPVGRSMLAIREDPRLDRDAADVQTALWELIRVYQFRDRERICRHELSVTQYHALYEIGTSGPLSMNALAARLYLDKSTTSRVVDSLERKRLATRTPNPADRRALLLQPTETGHALLGTIRGEVLAEEKRLLGEFEPAVRREMARLIGRLARAAAARIDTTGGTCTSIA
jgi:MarR family transcriptional regulator, 2-MHQ and catechol-resistance regulon repressor